ncbi:formimidoylglutamate deiminase [Acidipila rosea]|uniref:Formimidoylglutamate deiminase n=1 Tax=Acidipila rosea TaxID=768535 RepID=A0A4R1L6Z9_9BACT|nr:formimidoylglutamate deiminase [Acidipila rosea]TCK73988.1 formimidoylglutamate deiminase [Acidipila rosea]
MNTAYRPDLLYRGGSFEHGAALLVSEEGRILQAAPDAQTATVSLAGKAMLPGFVNTHSHSFQRLIRGKAESRQVSGRDFWSWRGTMYHAAARLSPEDVYDVARMAFLEMVRAGTTTVGEFHYLHTAPDGRPYADPNLLARQVIAAAQSVGIRIVLLRTAYLRSGFALPKDPGQTRFFETTAEFLANMDALLKDLQPSSESVRFGVAPHSIRAVPLADLHQMAVWARDRQLPLHMHVAEQLAENAACLREYGATPVSLLAREGLLGADFTAVHAIHITDAEIRMLADARATICSCPTTERNLGDGILAADKVLGAGIRIALGSDSQAQIDPLEDARELDYHLRLQQQERAILDQVGHEPLAARLLDCATINGAQSLQVAAGSLSHDNYADFFTVDRNDSSIAGHSADDLLSILAFGLNRSAIRDVVVNGKMILRDGRHPLDEEIVERYKVVHRKVWSERA